MYWKYEELPFIEITEEYKENSHPPFSLYSLSITKYKDVPIPFHTSSKKFRNKKISS